jgi:DNA repair exonuclease SbcCD nuclease subunit
VVRFLHTADLQLGMGRRFLTPEAQARFTHARIEVVRALGRLATEQDCELMVVCGDVFEANQLDRQVVVRSLEALADVPVPVLLLPGNHDPLDAGSIYTAHDMPKNVTVLRDAGVHVVRAGFEVVAAPWTSKRPLVDLLGAALASATPAPPGTVRIAVGHGAVDTLSPDRDNPALISLDRLERAPVHYVALGDRHSTTAVGATGRVWYSGAPEATDFDEVDPGNALVVEIDETNGEVTITSHHVGRWRFVRRAFAGDPTAITDWLASLPNKAETVVRLDLTGTVTLAERASVDAVLDHATPSFAALDVWDRLVVMPDALDVSALGLAGFAQVAFEELQEADDDEARDAVALLYRLTRPERGAA